MLCFSLSFYLLCRETNLGGVLLRLDCAFFTMGKSRKSYTTEFKMKAIAHLRELENNVSQCAAEVNVSRREIQRWSAQENELCHLQARI